MPYSYFGTGSEACCVSMVAARLLGTLGAGCWAAATSVDTRQNATAAGKIEPKDAIRAFMELLLILFNVRGSFELCRATTVAGIAGGKTSFRGAMN